MRVIVTAEPSDFLLAMRALEAALERKDKDTVICFQDGRSFLVRQTKSGWSVRADKGRGPGYPHREFDR